VCRCSRKSQRVSYYPFTLISDIRRDYFPVADSASKHILRLDTQTASSPTLPLLDCSGRQETRKPMDCLLDMVAEKKMVPCHTPTMQRTGQAPSGAPSAGALESGHSDVPSGAPSSGHPEVPSSAPAFELPEGPSTRARMMIAPAAGGR